MEFFIARRKFAAQLNSDPNLEMQSKLRFIPHAIVLAFILMATLLVNLRLAFPASISWTVALLPIYIMIAIGMLIVFGVVIVAYVMVPEFSEIQKHFEADQSPEQLMLWMRSPGHAFGPKQQRVRNPDKLHR